MPVTRQGSSGLTRMDNITVVGGPSG